MNSPATQSTAAASSGASAALVVVLLWLLSEIGVQMPDQVAAALVALISAGIHAAVIHNSSKRLSLGQTRQPAPDQAKLSE